MNPPRALLFAVFGTVVDWRTSLIDECTAFGAYGSILGSWTRLLAEADILGPGASSNMPVNWAGLGRGAQQLGGGANRGMPGDWPGLLAGAETGIHWPSVSRRNMMVDWAGLVDVWHSAYVPSMDRVRRGEQPWTTLDQLHRTTLDWLVVEFGIPELPEQDLHHLNTGWHRLRPWPDSVPGLTRLKRRFTIAPLSNGNMALLVNLAKYAGLRWDVIFGSDIFRHFKPDPETYLGACALLNLPPQEVMLCAAHNSDLRHARALGLRTAFIARPTEYGPHQRQDQEAEEPWDYVVASIEELADRLEA